ncbi:MAG: asparagine synthase (glutamine-hydrolyzing), partial [Ignavibacteriaceae bacterium]
MGYISNNKFDDLKLLKTLSHRGPNDEGVYEEILNDKNIFLGHKRLSILDLSLAGHQPMFSNDKDVIITYNGEVYNFLELKKKFLSGLKLKSNTDTEVILNLYLVLGEKLVNELNGDFAISILDKKENKLLLYRDRLGVKPLYYFNDSKTFFYASELKPFLAANLSKEISEEDLSNYFVFKYVPQNKTLLKNIFRVPPGNYIKVNLDDLNFQTIRFWDPDYETDYTLKFSEAKDEVGALLNAAVTKRLISDVPVGTFFSGGVDSSAIAYYLRDNENLIHYTARKNKNDLKEEGTTSDFDYAFKLAQDWKLNLQPINISADEANINLINITNYYSDDLIADGSQIPSYLITKEAAKSSTVLLSGMGADEIFLGYGNHLLTLLSQYFDKSPR